ncbi:MAG: DNA-protecting protein DprA [Ruminococcaceae bacterium]|nr:DNA-protecting protein DprA [Oscillospiraceae bacterium]
MSALKYWIWLAERRGIGAYSAHKLLSVMGSPEKIFFSLEKDYAKAGVNQKDIMTLMDKNMSDVRRIMDRCVEENWRVISIEDSVYPERLRNLHDAPLVLYIRGSLPVMDEEAAVAIVGTRKCTPYGIKSAERIAYEITKGGGLVVTGLARGIDTASAWGALRAGGRVIGVLGCGLDVVYPPENRRIFDDVAAVGAIISEFPPETPAQGRNFPMRNRIISGISLGTVIIEAPERSGALITAGHALEQGRDVFVVPGNIDADACVGSNRLMREGAIPIMSGWDILDEYRSLYPMKLGRAETVKITPPDEALLEKMVQREMSARHNETKKEIDNGGTLEYIDSKKQEPDLEGTELAVYNTLKSGRKHIDDIIIDSGLDAKEVLPVLTILEIKGYIDRSAGKMFNINQQFK